MNDTDRKRIERAVAEGRGVEFTVFGHKGFWIPEYLMWRMIDILPGWTIQYNDLAVDATNAPPLLWRWRGVQPGATR